jgi:hypothetical protein
MRPWISALAVVFLLPSGPGSAETLPLPETLIALSSEEGSALLFDADARADFAPLVEEFVTQVNPAFCGPASISMVLNALDLPRPPSEMTLGLGLFDQENLFNASTEAVKPRDEILRGGMTLDELGGVLAAYDLAVSVQHAADTDLDAFRETAVAALGDDDSFVLVNYLRSAMGQEKGGHISPLAAYDAETDRFLVLDVSRYKYPPIWVDAATLYGAMNTPDADNGGKSRGYLTVGR